MGLGRERILVGRRRKRTTMYRSSPSTSTKMTTAIEEDGPVEPRGLRALDRDDLPREEAWGRRRRWSGFVRLGAACGERQGRRERDQEAGEPTDAPVGGQETQKRSPMKRKDGPRNRHMKGLMGRSVVGPTALRRCHRSVVLLRAPPSVALPGRSPRSPGRDAQAVYPRRRLVVRRGRWLRHCRGTCVLARRRCRRPPPPGKPRAALDHRRGWPGWRSSSSRWPRRSSLRHELFSVHMVQHLLLVLVARPCSSWPRPSRWSSARVSRNAPPLIMPILHSTPVRVLSAPAGRMGDFRGRHVVLALLAAVRRGARE